MRGVDQTIHQLAAFLEETRRLPIGDAKLIELDAHINDPTFAGAALAVFDARARDGLAPAGRIG